MQTVTRTFSTLILEHYSYFCILWFSAACKEIFQGQMWVAKLKSAYNLLIIGPKGSQYKTNS